MTAPDPASAPHYSYLLPPSFTGFTDVKTFLYNSRLLLRFPMGSPGVPTPPGFLFSLHRRCPHLLKRQQRRIQALFGSNTKQTPTFWRPRSTLSANNRTKMCPFSTGHSMTLQEGPIPTMLHAMNPSSGIVSRAGGGGECWSP